MSLPYRTNKDWINYINSVLEELPMLEAESKSYTDPPWHKFSIDMTYHCLTFLRNIIQDAEKKEELDAPNR